MKIKVHFCREIDPEFIFKVTKLADRRWTLSTNRGKLFGNETTALLHQKYGQYSHFVNRLFTLDKNNIVTISLTQRDRNPL